MRVFLNRWAVIILVIGLFLGTAGTVLADNNGKALWRSAIDARWNNFERAVNLYPNPTNLVNFPLRGALVKFTERQDQINHPWYTYLIPVGGQGQAYYFVTQTYPQSVCNFLSSSNDLMKHPSSDVIMEVTAPSYDGILYSNCPDDQYFFFDQATDALLVFGGPIVQVTSDKPLSLYANAVPVTVVE